ncbi:uncharacterized protein LOC126673366 [Mercurialis annua]|uniref:uncharacterized protein LOC126673366 n=1 Tax=Mercurialis annua TaxID=3986 RepID=UPI00215DDA0E|nr:uncharacterized protein LOC126673366 [Mercurialis annua]
MDPPCRCELSIWEETSDSIPEDDDLIRNDNNLYINMRTRFVVLDLEHPQPLTYLADTFRQKLFHSPSYLPSGEPPSQRSQQKTIDRIVRFARSLINQNADNNSNNVITIGVKYGATNEEEEEDDDDDDDQLKKLLSNCS